MNEESIKAAFLGPRTAAMPTKDDVTKAIVYHVRGWEERYPNDLRWRLLDAHTLAGTHDQIVFTLASVAGGGSPHVDVTLLVSVMSMEVS